MVTVVPWNMFFLMIFTVQTLIFNRKIANLNNFEPNQSIINFSNVFKLQKLLHIFFNQIKVNFKMSVLSFSGKTATFNNYAIYFNRLTLLSCFLIFCFHILIWIIGRVKFLHTTVCHFGFQRKEKTQLSIMKSVHFLDRLSCLVLLWVPVMN